MEHIMNKNMSSSRPSDPRADGWTADRIRTFLHVLADCGCVTEAARAAGVGVGSAYRLRNSAEGGAFHLAWEAALRLARRRLADMLKGRARSGRVDPPRGEGRSIVKRFRFEFRFSLATFTRLDRRERALGEAPDAVRIVADGFEPFVRIAGAGGPGALDFLVARGCDRADSERLLGQCAARPPRAAPGGRVEVGCDRGRPLRRIEKAFPAPPRDSATFAGAATLSDVVSCLARGGSAWLRPCFRGHEWLIWNPPTLPVQETNGNRELHEL